MISPANLEAHEMLAAQQSACRKIIAMVDELVSSHMLETGRRQLKWAPLELDGLIRESLADMGKTAAGKDITLDFTCAVSALTVTSDENALRHVVDNLVSNAIKYSPPSSEIRIELRREGPGCLLRVIDQGPGVRPEESEKIFERFARGSAQPTGGEKSTGLGLWIVRRTLADLHGKVWCEPRPDARGTIFSVFVPRDVPPVR